MDWNDEDRSLRRIVLRFLNESEELAREELDKIIQAIEEYIGHQPLIQSWTIPTIIIFTPIFLIFSILLAPASKLLGNSLFVAALAACLLPLFMVWRWHRNQYGTGRLRKPREALYLGASEETIAALEKLFAYLQREDGPKLYYRDKHGKQHFLNRRNFFGSLRVLLLSEFSSVRELCLTPTGGRIAAAIKIDADPAEVLKILAIKPKRPAGHGRYAKYPYADALVSFLGDSDILSIDATRQEMANTAIRRRLNSFFVEHVDDSGAVPRADQVQELVRKIYVRLCHLQGRRPEPEITRKRKTDAVTQ
ncbi:hypothetical protein [Novosphingobium terrae]|uniref:hypothetical protein n=1 Tax=Novosphingobium terrae TaxID=2726189 RepID=UPI00197D9A4D|nr:hypothetical protein [Novosphingobium terrae]